MSFLQSLNKYQDKYLKNKRIDSSGVIHTLGIPHDSCSYLIEQYDKWPNYYKYLFMEELRINKISIKCMKYSEESYTEIQKGGLQFLLLFKKVSQIYEEHENVKGINIDFIIEEYHLSFL